MAHGIMILECPRTPQSEVWARSYGVLSEALPRDSAQHINMHGQRSVDMQVGWIGVMRVF